MFEDVKAKIQDREGEESQWKIFVFNVKSGFVFNVKSGLTFLLSEIIPLIS